MIFQAARELVLHEQHTHTYFSTTLPQVASSCHLSPVLSIKIFNSLRRSHHPLWRSFVFTGVTPMKNKQYMLWNLSEKGLLLAIWLIIQPALYWDSRTFDLRYNNSQRQHLFLEFQRAYVLTHTRLITTPDSLQVSMRSLGSKIRVSSVYKILTSETTLDLCVTILVMLLHTNPVKQTKVKTAVCLV